MNKQSRPSNGSISSKDSMLLRELAAKLAEIAALPVQRQRIAEWKRLNSLKPGRPMVLVWASETPWQEMNVNDELTLRCEGELAQSIEQGLRRKLYQWNHMPGDMVIENRIECYPAVHDTGHGIQWAPDEAARTDNPIVSRHFNPVIKEPEDLEKIVMPTVTFDKEETASRLRLYQDLFGDIMPVVMGGPRGYWFCPMDELIVYWGIQEMLTDLVMRPEMVHAGMERMSRWHESRVRQWEDLGLLSLNNNASIITTGGYGFTDELPAKGFTPAHVRTIDSWGSAATQIFGTVSPEMHWEFSAQYEARFLKRFGLVAYGCCDPLHNKLDVVDRLPNVRRLSMSPWANHNEGTERVGRKYIYSLKPNPAPLAVETWDPDEPRRRIREVLTAARKHGCVVEIILKDVSTVRGEPQRLWDWARIAVEEAERMQ